MIEVNNLVKKYGDHLAVDNISFTVEDGRIYGFLGPNGAGKSTTMNIITGYLAATSGQILVDGHDILLEPEAAKRAIGYLPEIPPLYVDMTVREYLNFSAELKGIRKKTDRIADVERAVELAGLTEFAGRLIRTLSKGYKQRVGIAQALIGSPRVLILDEPTVGLDPRQIIEIRELIKRLGRTHTVILSTHILPEVSEVCDHVLIISRGKLVASDTPENLNKILNQKNMLELSVEADEQTLADVLSGVSGILSITPVSVESSGADGTAEQYYHIEVSDPSVRRDIFYAMAERKLPLLSMQIRKSSMEEMFLELTADTVNRTDKEGGEEA